MPKRSKKQLYTEVIEWFEQTMPTPQTELHFQNNFQLLVAVILSAQCTDKRVNTVTPPLFEAYPDAKSMAVADPVELYGYIKSVSYPNNKTSHLLAACKMIVEKFNGEVPSEFDDLLSLPGVGRKTANVMLSVAFGRAAMAVDTHVFRVSERIGLTTRSRTPLETEKTLVRYIPQEKLSRAHHWLILHGRYVCKALKPNCKDCGLRDICRYHINQNNTQP